MSEWCDLAIGQGGPHAHRRHRPAGLRTGSAGIFLKLGDTVAGVFCTLEKTIERPDALRLAAEAAGM